MTHAPSPLPPVMHEIDVASHSAHGCVREHSRYFGVELDDRSLTPGDDASIAPTHFEDWLTQWSN